MKTNFKTVFAAFCLVILLRGQAVTDVTLPRLISDGLVLQRDARVHVWGWAEKGEPVTVKFLDKTWKTTADNKGEWKVTLPKLDAGGPYRMEISGNNKLVLNDILIGEVWLASGQSNMDLNMGRVEPLYENEIVHSENSEIRRFFVSTRYDFDEPQQDLESGSWESASPQTIRRFTATGYFFAKALYDHFKVPIGIIHASVGGSPAESWMSQDALQQFPEHLKTAIQFRDTSFVNNIIRNDRARSRDWYNRLRQADLGYAGDTPWFDPSIDVSDWPTMSIPGFWKDGDLGFVNGVLWFRRTINVPESMTGKPAKLLLGRIVDADSVFVNGTFVGTTSYQYPPRRYEIPADVLKPGKNVIVARIINSGGAGGFILDKPYELIVGEERIDLQGDWRYKLGATMPPLAPQTFIRWKPLGLYNGMIAPLLNATLKGVIWYQGEANTSNAVEYQQLFPALIRDWRQQWDLGKFPFLYVQLANYMKARPQPSESNWAELREAQLQTLSVPKTGMAVAIDIGEWNDIHPLNKKAVGDRLALAARHIAYGEDIVYSGPIYKSKKIKGNKVYLSFAHVGSGLVAKGRELQEFAIAGADGQFVWAQAKIEGDRVVVWNDNITKPVAVRYAWADNPENANLYNQEGLPASPFRTDD